MVDNKMMEAATDGYIDLQLTPDETKELMAILNFSVTASRLLADQEMVKGTYKGAAQMNRITHNAQKLLEIVTVNAQIGNPLPGIN